MFLKFNTALFRTALFLTAAAAFFSCREERVLATSDLNLRFSADTVFLDTVFSGVNSSTYQLKVYNDNDEPIAISSVALEGGAEPFRLNVNGTNASNVQDVEIEANDSIYVFVELTANQTCKGQDGFICEDRIVFQDDQGNAEYVTLVAEVKDAIFHFPDRFLNFGGTFLPYSIIDCDATWDASRPHVIYGYAVVDSGCSLTIQPGTDVHFHNNSGLWVFDNATLDVAVGAQPGQGDSVTFQGDRLEPSFENSSGQWGGPLGGLFIDGSARVRLNNMVIKNAVNAVRTDSATIPNQLEITNSYILNSSRTALFGGFGDIDARNLVVANAGLYCFYALGGNYEFRHSTFANFWRGSTRSDPAVFLTNFFEFRDENGTTQRLLRDLEKAYFGNCILDGNARQEFSIAEDEGAMFEYEFNAALLKLENDVEDRGFDINNGNFTDVSVNTDPAFVNPGNNVFRLDTGSQAIDIGNISDGLSIPTDILGRNRNFNASPDLGAYERQF